MKALVTGASGFLGGHIAEGCLRAGDEVRVLVRRTSDTSHLRTLPGVEFAYGDLTDTDALRRAAEGTDVVYHSAARVTDFGTRARFRAENVTATEHLLDAARRGGASRFVFVSSPSALMDRGDGDRLGIDETCPYPRRYYNHYSRTKAEAERIVLAADAPGFTTCALRPRGIWGPRDRQGFVPRMLTAMRAGRLPDLSGGRPVMASLCYCDNAVDACLRAARSDRVGGRAYFIADGEETDLWRFLGRLAHLFSVPPPGRRVPVPVRDGLALLADLVWKLPPLAARSSPPLSRYAVALLARSATYDTGAARRDFGYRPLVGQEEGLDAFAAWVHGLGGLDGLDGLVRGEARAG